MRDTPAWFVFAVVVLLWAAACRSVGPMHALTSTIPLNAESERLAYLGEASGKACHATLLYFIPLENDSSIYQAKRAAMLDASARYARPAVALVDVSIDVESVSYLVYTRVCTWVRGKALGADTRPQVAHAVQPPPPPVTESAREPEEPATTPAPAVPQTQQSPLQ